MIETLNVTKYSKSFSKSFFRKKFRQIPHEKCSFSIEKLIVEAFRMDALNLKEKNLD